MNFRRARLAGLAIGSAVVLLFLLGYALFWPLPFVHKIAAHESMAVGHLSAVFEKQEQYRASHDGTFADGLNKLPDITSSDRSYFYELQVTGRDERGRVTKYLAKASPSVAGKTGTRYFSIDETRTLRVEEMRPVTANSPVLE